ncbi:hypothetical protein H4R33_003219 [Dimargaris cristalligena]|nr:hypothetical protein H4R33_003219 [Dimargaris cristalligena]
MKALPTNVAIDNSHVSMAIDLIQNPVILRGTKSTCRGTIINGYLTLSVSEPTRLRALLLCFKGIENINCVDAGVSIVTQRTFFCHTWQFLPLRTANHRVSNGHHSYYFEVALAGDLPETISTHQARVHYTLTALAVRPTFRKDLTVERPVVVQRYALLPTPSSMALYYEPESLSNQGKLGPHIAYQLQVAERRLTPGDKVNIQLHFRGLAHSFVSKVWIVLMENTLLTEALDAPWPETNGPLSIGGPTTTVGPSPPTNSSPLAGPMNSPDGTLGGGGGGGGGGGVVGRPRSIHIAKHLKEVVDTQFPDLDPITRTVKRQYLFTIPAQSDTHYDTDTEHIRIRHRIRMVFQVRNKLQVEGHIALSFSVRLWPGKPAEMIEPPPQYHSRSSSSLDNGGSSMASDISESPSIFALTGPSVNDIFAH